MTDHPKTLILTTGAVLLLCGCANPQFSLMSKEKQPQTHEEWIAAQNAKNELCKPIDGLKSNWVASGSTGYHSYVEYCKEGRIVYQDTTKEVLVMEAQLEAKKDGLVMAARSRLLTPEELKELLNYGPDIFIHNMQQYQKEDVDRQFNDLLFQQARLRSLK